MKNYYFLFTIAFIIISFSSFSQGWVGTGTTIYPVSSNSTLAPLNVGIGTNAPSAQFHTTGTVRFQGLTTNNALTNAVVSDATGNLFLRDISNSVAGNAWLLTGNNGITSNNFLGTINAADLKIRTNNIERMTVTSTGNIGIGITNPSVEFQVVNGTAGSMGHPYETGIIERNGDNKFGIYSTLTNTALGGSAIVLGYSQFQMPNSLYPNYEIQQGMFVNDPNSFYLRFNALSRNAAGNVIAPYQNVMIMDNLGRVGINLFNGLPALQPTANLHINGTVRFQNLPSGGGNYLVVDKDGNVFKSSNSIANRPVSNNINSDDLQELKNEVANLKSQVEQLLKIVNQKNLTISDNLKKRFLVYPNPANDILKISALNENLLSNQKVILQTIEGRTINSFSMSNSLLIPTKNITAGTYIVNIYENNTLVQSEKIIINK